MVKIRIFHCPVQINGEYVYTQYFAHGLSGSAMVSLALCDPLVMAILGDRVVESVDYEAHQRVNIIVKDEE